jgi:hypothetical protein
MIRFKNFLTEGTDASTLFEGVIAVCLSMSGYSQKRFKDNILKQKEIKVFLKVTKSDWAVDGKTKKEKANIFWKFSQLCKSKLPATKADAGFGQTKPKISAFWTNTTGKGVDTSKADIKVGKYQCSVKGPKAQLMSGEQKETRATILAALELSGQSGWLKKQLMEEVDKFVTSTRTVGEELNGRILKQMSVKDVKEYDKELLKKKRIDSLKDGNASAKKIIDSQEKMKATITSTFEKAFSKKSVGGAFAYESMTGYEKFGGQIFGKAGDKSGQATHMIIWNYSMDQLRWQKLTPKYAAQISTKMKVRPDLKTNSYSKKVNGKKQKLGYSFYQSLRVSVETIFKETDKLQESFYYDLINQSKILSEGKLTDWIKNTWNKIKEKIKNMWLWFNEKIMELKNIANEIINTDIESALNLFELDVGVKVNSEVTL